MTPLAHQQSASPHSQPAPQRLEIWVTDPGWFEVVLPSSSLAKWAADLICSFGIVRIEHARKRIYWQAWRSDEASSGERYSAFGVAKFLREMDEQRVLRELYGKDSENVVVEQAVNSLPADHLYTEEEMIGVMKLPTIQSLRSGIEQGDYTYTQRIPHGHWQGKIWRWLYNQYVFDLTAFEHNKKRAKEVRKKRKKKTRGQSQDD